MDTFNVQNIIDGQAISVSITGMSIVFCGLLLISGYIAILPVILDYFLEKISKRKAAASKPVSSVKEGATSDAEAAALKESESHDIASVIGLVLQLENERLIAAENEQITITRNIHQPSMWGSSGKMRRMPQRRTHA